MSMSCAVNDRPLAFPVVVLAVAKHKRSFGRFEVATVEDPEVPDSGCTLSVIVRTGGVQASGYSSLAFDWDTRS